MDGRNLRAQRTKDALLLARLALAQRGMWRPSPETVALTAGVSVRSFFQHFQNMENFNEEFIRRHEASLRAIMWDFPDPLRLVVLGRP
jgi:AcrR family transcriptional regulator